NELITVKRYEQMLMSGSNKTLVFVVLANDDLNQGSMEQRVRGGDPKTPETQTLPYLPAAEFATLLGFEGIKVERPEDVGTGWDRTLSGGGPVILEVCTQLCLA